MSPNTELRKLPAVDRLLANPKVAELLEEYGRVLVTAAIRQVVAALREDALNGGSVPAEGDIIERVRVAAQRVASPSLKPVFNASGIVLHTNLGRAPMHPAVIRDLEPLLAGYSNLELDLTTGARGSRNAHLASLIRHLTGAEDAIVVNNNAAAVVLALTALAGGGEAIVSRGELVEIGGSFRMPDIMEASGARMVEVGTTNRTHIDDYENAITDATRVLFKAHRSNFFVGGFTHEVEIAELAALGKRRGLTPVYDIGSGLLNRPENLALDDEPDVRGAIDGGADLVTFSGDKLLGGPQAGLIVGSQAVVSRLAKAPLMRALRVGKMTISALTTVLSSHLEHSQTDRDIPALELLGRSAEERKQLAEALQLALAKRGVGAKIVESVARSGGGTLPALNIDSSAVELSHGKGQSGFAEQLHHELLQLERPILAIIREGRLLFDVMALFPDQLDAVAKSISDLLPTRDPNRESTQESAQESD